MANGFRLIRELVGESSLLERVLLTASTQFYFNELLTLPAAAGAGSGIAAAAAATDSPTHVLVAVETPASMMRPAIQNLTTTVGEMGLCYNVAGTGLVFETDLTGADAPPINGTAIKTVTNATTIVVTAAGSSNDYRGGQLYIPEIDQQRTIVSDTANAGDHTFVVTPAFTVLPVATSNTVRVLPWSKGNVQIKLSASTGAPMGVSTAVADKSGGKVKIESVNLKDLKVRVSFPAVY